MDKIAAAEELVRLARELVSGADIDWPDEYYEISESSDKITPASIFIGRWFMSKKPKDPALYRSLAKTYPYRGKAYRQDYEVPYGGKYGSWSKTERGLQNWRDQAGIGIIYSGTITKGIDLTKLIKGEGLEDDYGAQLIMKVAEVVPIERVKDIERIWPMPGPVDRIAKGVITSSNKQMRT